MPLVSMLLTKWISVLDGTQPTLVQSPPTCAASTTAVFLPRALKPAATVSPPEPAPMMRVW